MLRLQESDTEVQDHSDATNSRHDIQQAMGYLSEEQRTIVTMKYYMELTFSEIGEVIALPESIVKSKLYKALIDMKRYLRRVKYES